MFQRVHLPLAGCTAAFAVVLATMPAHAQHRCPERVQIAFGETAADIAWRCGVTPEALDRANPGLSRANERVGVVVRIPQPALPSRPRSIGGNRFVPVPTPPGALGR
jgi:hypothetical protein